MLTLMHTLSWRTLPVLLGAGLLAGCEPATTELAAPPEASRPSLRFTNGPAELVNVVRFTEEILGVLLVDPETELVLLQGEFCAGDEPIGDLVSIQLVGLRRGVIHSHILGRDMTLSVYDLNSFDFTFERLCDLTPIATGTGRFHYTDNDLNITSGHASAFGFRMHGELTSPETGERMRLAAVAHFVLDADGELHTEHTNIRLTSGGGR